ncbi:dihydrofolate reductase family protein [Mycobacterium sp. ITM-2016-00318]|uniref:dihydrofolate reductase family protein n=1 Tax=Mycobacterium sp. ITM-2016-00318 TaxID=2099693 RepID=UPI000CF86BA2|nr:dihydrofolate reductase family protein [Mycobacterium sp. ITM-2016-00318]WNG93110.1 dihydrofolate reductase family protein [Mycobacterium sp. ITM-2016-00318]
MATVYYTASSIDGYIVDDRNSLHWLLSRNIDADGPFGYRAFEDSVGAVVMGATTYEWILANDSEWHYKQPTWVLTHRSDIVRAGDSVTAYQGDVTALHPLLVQAAGYQDVWVVGGGETTAQFANAGLIDEMIVSYAPCTLGTGGRLLPLHTEWQLIESGVNGDFVCARWRRG